MLLKTIWTWRKIKNGVICLLSLFCYWAMDLKMSKRFFLGASEKLYCLFEKTWSYLSTFLVSFLSFCNRKLNKLSRKVLTQQRFHKMLIYTRANNANNAIVNISKMVVQNPLKHFLLKIWGHNLNCIEKAQGSGP